MSKENPNWKRDLLARLVEREKAKMASRGISDPQGKLTAGQRSSLTVVSFREWLDLLNRAAAEHGLSTSSYVRRILSVWIAKDLDMPIRSVLDHCPPVTVSQYIKRTDFRLGGGRDDGKGIEYWCPHPGCTGEHIT